MPEMPESGLAAGGRTALRGYAVRLAGRFANPLFHASPDFRRRLRMLFYSVPAGLFSGLCVYLFRDRHNFIAMKIEEPEQRNWSVLKQEYLLRRPWCTVRHESLRLPDGRIIPDWYVFEFPDWVNVIARRRDGRFVFVSQYRPGLRKTMYEIPAGVIDPEDASPLDAARRELLEETGYGGGEWRLMMTLSANPTNHNNLTYCFVAEGVEPVADRRPDSTEDIECHLFTADELRWMLDGNLIPQALHAAPLWRYMAEMER